MMFFRVMTAISGLFFVGIGGMAAVFAGWQVPTGLITGLAVFGFGCWTIVRAVTTPIPPSRC